jgi:sugar-specific transcriptional regulator TrmB
LRQYKALGYRLLGTHGGSALGKDGASAGEVVYSQRDILFDDTSYIPYLQSDLKLAQKSVTIMLPILSRTFIKPFLDRFDELFQKGVSVKIISRSYVGPSSSTLRSVKNTVKLLEEKGVRVDLRESAEHQFFTIDQDIVWYGSFSGQEISVICIEDADVAGEFLDVARNRVPPS